MSGTKCKKCNKEVTILWNNMGKPYWKHFNPSITCSDDKIGKTNKDKNNLILEMLEKPKNRPIKKCRKCKGDVKLYWENLKEPVWQHLHTGGKCSEVVGVNELNCDLARNYLMFALASNQKIGF